MRLTEIHVDQFGVWKDLNLKLSHPGLTVMYGPNETGKSTLMRFLKGMFYGFQTENQEGSLSISQNGNVTQIHRKSNYPYKNQVSLSGYAKNQPHDKFLESTLGGINESLFESIYAIGLEEIQRLGTLQKKDVGKHIFGNSLGPEGQALLKMSEELHASELKYYQSHSETGIINQLLELEKQFSRESDQNETPRKKHYQISQKLTKLQKDTDNLKKRQAGMKYQLRGHEYMKQVHEPWKRVNRLQKKLDKIPSYSNFPLNSLEKIEHIDEELHRLKKQRSNLKAELKGSIPKLKKISVNSSIRDQLALMSYFVKHSEYHFQKKNNLKK